LYRQCRAGAQINFPESGRGLGHVTPTIFGSTVGYPSDSLAFCYSFTDWSLWVNKKVGKPYSVADAWHVNFPW